jgi:DNA-directed RNA polymerase specialized sigma24 family protein
MPAYSVDSSVTQWIADLKEGRHSAAQHLWECYFERLVGLARTKLAAAPRRFADEEDVALSAFKSLCLGAAKGQFTQLRDRDNLWPLLVILTVRKAQDLVKHERRQKRSARTAAGGVVPPTPLDLETLLSREPTPELSAMLAENCEQMLGRLDRVQRKIADLKLEGHTNAEIATRLDCGLRTVERRLELIRQIWDCPA